MDILAKIRENFSYQSVIIIILAVGIFSSIMVYNSVDTLSKKSLESRTKTIATALSVPEVALLSGDPESIHSLLYKDIKLTLMRMRGYSDDIRFIYLMKKMENSDIIFLVDSEPTTSPDYSAPGDVYSEVSSEFRATFDTRQTIVEETSDRWGKWLSSAVPIIDDSGRVVAILGVDISAHGYNQALLYYSVLPLLICITIAIIVWVLYRQHKRQLEYMELQKRVLSAMSHDIRSPLTGIRWSLETMQSDTTLSPSNKEMIETDHELVVKVINTLNDLLETLRRSVTVPLKSDISVSDCIESAQQNLAQFAESKNVTVIRNLTIKNTDTLYSSKEDLVRLFENVLSNAIKYSKEGSVVEIRAQFSDGFYKIAIQDAGIGIPKEEQEKVTKGLYRATNAKEFTKSGTGFGMQIMNQIVLDHKGTLEYESVVGAGTT